MGEHICAVFGCLVLESPEFHVRFVACLVRNGAQDHKGNVIEIGCVGNRGPFHFCADGMKGIDQARPLFRGTDELVTADYASFMDADIGSCIAAGPGCQAAEKRIRGKAAQYRTVSESGENAGFIAKGAEIQIVVHRVCTDYDVPDVNTVIQGACDPGIDEVCDLKTVDQDLFLLL